MNKDEINSKIIELEQDIEELREEYDRIDNGTNCSRQFAITTEIGSKQEEIASLIAMLQ